jgi:Protein of unknown function (DUF1173)
MGKYLFGETLYSTSHDSWQRILQKAHASRVRPVCVCLPEGSRSAMYVTHAHGAYVLKRLPDTGSLHAAFCEHYEPPPELSGLGQVTGTAIREQPETDTTALSLDFPLTKSRSRVPGTASEVEHESVRADGTKLTLRGLLHYLWDEAGLTRWTPAMAGKRSWYVVRRELLAAASSKIAKGKPLADLLFVPETFSSERLDEIKRRQVESLSRLALQSNDRMLFIGAVKGFDEARFGKSLVVKHLPDLKLMMGDDMHKHLQNRFAHQLQLWGQFDSTQLIVIATVSRSSQGVYSVESACLMNVNSQWIPFESAFELELLERMHSSARRFSKGLRYNLGGDKPLACAVANDTGDMPVALFVVPQELMTKYDATLEVVAEEGRLGIWRWNAGVEALPELPGRKVGGQERP